MNAKACFLKLRSALFSLLALPLLLLPGTAWADVLQTTFYDMGKADAAIITTENGQHILIDTGTNGGGKKLVKSLEAAGIRTIDLLIVTHFDKDHVGGADKVLESVSVRHAIMPRYDKESKQYTQFCDALSASSDTQQTWLSAGETYALALGDTELLISAAHKTDYGFDEENDFSLCTRVRYGQTRFLFPGDAEDARQTELLTEGDIACDVLKVPYHGRLVDASPAFLTACAPQIAFIPDSEKDPAHPLVAQVLASLGCTVYSAQHGDLTVVSDGETVSVKP